MRGRLLIPWLVAVVALLCVPLAGSSPGRVSACSLPPPSSTGGTVSAMYCDATGQYLPTADYLQFTISGADLKLQPGKANAYQGSAVGKVITLSGQMSVTIAKGYVSDVSMSARMATKKLDLFAGRVTGQTVTRPFNLTFTIGKDATEPASGGTYVSGEAVLNICGGICAGFSIGFIINLPKKTPGTTTTKPTTTTKRPPGVRDMSWEMPDRFGIKINEPGSSQNGMIRYFTSRGTIDPKQWWVRFTLPGCDQGELRDYAWKVDGKPTQAKNDLGTCKVLADVKKLGKHRVTADPPGDGDTYATAVDARDFLIVGLGDSVASGEGNPDFAKDDGGVRWQDPRCDRSANSFEARAAIAIEKHDRKTSVTFVHLACSGAGIANGVHSAYWGITPGDADKPLLSQATQMKQLIGGREVDAVLVSAGANDIGFGPVLEFCVKWGWDNEDGCPANTFKDGKPLREVINQRLAALPGLYNLMAGRLASLVASSKRVYLNTYPDQFRDESGHVCTAMIGSLAGTLKIDQIEATWMSRSVLAPLNAAIMAAAAAHGWKAIADTAKAFTYHGYCAGAASWVTTYEQSMATQGDQNGTMHPNATGHWRMAQFATKLLTQDLFPGGKPRPTIG